MELSTAGANAGSEHIEATVISTQRAILASLLVGLVLALSSGYLLIRAINRSIAKLMSAVAVTRTGNQQQLSTANEIAATTSEIGATSQEISSTSKELVRTMNEVSTVAEQSAGLAGSGQVGLTHMEATMQQVVDAAAAINAKLAVLSEKAGNINQVVTTITRVADQTNLLSLNAAIEAEKAGEYGRGFAVVATEIRRLADQTAVATYDIDQIVKEIQSAVAAGVMGMDKFSQEVRRGMQEVQQVGGQLSQIIQQVQALAPRVESVNEGMQAQMTGAGADQRSAHAVERRRATDGRVAAPLERGHGRPAPGGQQPGRWRLAAGPARARDRSCSFFSLNSGTTDTPWMSARSRKSCRSSRSSRFRGRRRRSPVSSPTVARWSR